jgi:hypothetical protein
MAKPRIAIFEGHNPPGGCGCSGAVGGKSIFSDVPAKPTKAGWVLAALLITSVIYYAASGGDTPAGRARVQRVNAEYKRRKGERRLRKRGR